MTEESDPSIGPRQLRSAAPARRSAPDPLRLEDDRERLKVFADKLENAVDPWPPTAARSEIHTLARSVHTFLESTAPDALPALRRQLRGGKPAALEVARAASDAVAGLTGLYVVVDGVGSATASAEQGDRQRRALVDAARELRGLAVAMRAMADSGPAAAEWTVATAVHADDLSGTLAGIIDRNTDGTEDRTDERAEAPADAAADLSAVLGRGAFRESCQAHGFRAAAVLLLLVIAGVAWSVLWRSPLDAADLTLDLAKLSTAIPLALLVAYLQKEAARHRSAAVRLAELKLQLAYVDRYFSGVERRARRAELWERWALGAASVDTGSPTVSDDLAKLLERIADLVKSVGRG